MSLSLTINIRDRATPRLQRIIDGIADRANLHLAIGKRAQNCICDYLIGLAGSRHDTAKRLGAQPSGHLAKAAEKVGMAESLHDTGDGVAISINQPGMARAFRDVEIRPTGGKKYLTIPMTAEAYNNRAYRFSDLFIPKGKRVLMQQKTGKIFYLLVKSVRQKQDRSLLPSEEEITNAALAGAEDYVRYLNRK